MIAEVMVCGHPRECLVQSDEDTAYCGWCEEVARLRQALAKRIHKHRADVASILYARNEFEGQVYEWYEECCEEVERLRGGLEKAEAIAQAFVQWQETPCLDTAKAVDTAAQKWKMK